MSATTTPVFGKRSAAPRAGSVSPASPGATAEHDAFFAAVRAEQREADDRPAVVVPFSYKSASLAGLVVGCAFAGFDIRGDAGALELERFAVPLGLHIDTSALMPALILLGLLGGTRVAVISAILVHAILRQAGITSQLAYAAAGAATSALIACALAAALGRPPPHGWAIELVAGAAAGLLYRVFAGARPARDAPMPHRVCRADRGSAAPRP